MCNLHQEECGCGIVFGTDPSGSLVCRSFVPGGPAESSGLVQVSLRLAQSFRGAGSWWAECVPQSCRRFQGDPRLWGDVLG